MKKIALTIIALSVMSSAQAAVLDVHGEIKINGKTVINDKGVVVSSDSIDLEKYFSTNANGVAILEGTQTAKIDNGYPEYEEDAEYKEVPVKYEFTTSGGHFVKQVVNTNNVITWQAEWKDFTENSNTSIIYDEWDGCTVTSENTFTLAGSALTGTTSIGQTRTQLDLYDSVSTHKCPDSEATTTTTSSNTDFKRYIPLALVEFKNNDLSYPECLVVFYDALDSSSVRTYCAGVGVVEIQNIDENNAHTKLTSFTPGN